MALYTIGEVALLCEVNPVTLRAWQRRYGLLQPLRTHGGHRLFTEEEIDRIREIKRWVDTGVQISKVQKLLAAPAQEMRDGWLAQQETALRYLQQGNINRLHQWVKEHGRDYPAQALATYLFIPLRLRLQSQLAMLSLLDGILINYIAGCLASARKKPGKEALLVGWNVADTTQLWLEGWMASQQGWRVDVLAHALSELQPEMFPGQTLLVWCGAPPLEIQQQQILRWRDAGHNIWLLGI
ncbi:MerR family transcriptional regulator [Enterobacter sp. Bisph1]|uniref:MerR family transcriptional regulator n=1 Tax=Enterobacter sp. Bisph1 TaxID=1274399 RepID=UPI00057C2152|nr:MerR family transcriptional regulator [Enterobacter sp. Bisph1]